MAKTKILSSFNRLQLVVFHALWNLYNPHPSQLQQNSSRKRSQSLPREDPLRLFSIGTTVVKKSGSSKTLLGQVCDYRVPYWKVQYEDNDWEELSRLEMHRTTRSSGSPYLQHRVTTLLLQHGRRHQNHPTRNPFWKSTTLLVVVLALVLYVCMVITYSKSMDQPGKVANPARSQLNRENEYFPARVRA